MVTFLISCVQAFTPRQRLAWYLCAVDETQIITVLLSVLEQAIVENIRHEKKFLSTLI